MVNTFYDLATDFYEFGWGQCFHFAVQRRGETLNSAIARHVSSVLVALQRFVRGRAAPRARAL